MKRSLVLALALAVLFTSATVWAADAMAPTTTNRVCAQGETVSGVDLSEYQPDPVFTQIAKSGKKFRFVKATEGKDILNQDFSKHWPDAKAAGMIRGAYHYFVATDDPTQQASFFTSTVGQLETDDLPPMLDWETSTGVDPVTTVARAKMWLERVEQATGKTPIIYTGPAYWRSLQVTGGGFDHYPLFIADTNVTCPDVPLPWKTWTFWQHAVGKTPGITQASDLDMFNGLMQSLESFARSAGF
jgi:lysozyme